MRRKISQPCERSLPTGNRAGTWRRAVLRLGRGLPPPTTSQPGRVQRNWSKPKLHPNEFYRARRHRPYRQYVLSPKTGTARSARKVDSFALITSGRSNLATRTILDAGGRSPEVRSSGRLLV